MHIKPDIMTVLQGRMITILYLAEEFTEMYKGQESHAKLLEAVRAGIRKLEPVSRMVPQKFEADVEGCVAEVIGEHAVNVCQLCANAGWFVAEIEAVISDTCHDFAVEQLRCGIGHLAGDRRKAEKHHYADSVHNLQR